MQQKVIFILFLLLINFGFSQNLFDDNIEKKIPNLTINTGFYMSPSGFITSKEEVLNLSIPLEQKNIQDSLKKFGIIGSCTIKAKFVVEEENTYGYIINKASTPPKQETFLVLCLNNKLTDCLRIAGNIPIKKENTPTIGRISSFFSMDFSLMVFNKLEKDIITEYYIKNGKFINSKN